MKINTIIVSAFPGCGKTTATRELKGKINVVDSDGSTFDKTKFPNNYIEYIKSQLGKQELIFVSSHETVRHALENEKLEYFLFYPSITRKEEFLDLYYRRGNNKTFIEVLDKNFDNFINSCDISYTPHKIILNKDGEFLLNNKEFIKIIEEIKNT